MNIQNKRQKISTRGLLCELNHDVLNKKNLNAQGVVLRSGTIKVVSQPKPKRKIEVELFRDNQKKIKMETPNNDEIKNSADLKNREVECMQKNLVESEKSASQDVARNEEFWNEMQELWNSDIENINWDDIY